MARSTRTSQMVVVTGLQATYTGADAAGEQFANNGKKWLHVKNGGASPINVTVATPSSIDPESGLTVPDRVVAVTNATDKFIGPFATGVYNQSGADAGLVFVDYSAVTSVTVALLEHP